VLGAAVYISLSSLNTDIKIKDDKAMINYKQQK
jgi:hypothetical protein